MQRISVITVNFNNRDGLFTTIKSVLHQTYKNIEYIIIDGGSTDGSTDVMSDYLKSGKFNKFVRFYSCSEYDGGIYYGMNKGIAQATGDYCLFLNSGDYFCDDTVLNKVFGNKNYSEDLVIGRQKHITRLGFSHSRHFYLDLINKYFFFADTFPHQCTFIRKSMLEKTKGYHTDYKIVSDWIFWYEAVVDYNATISITDTHIAIQQPNGVSSNLDKCISETNAYLMKRNAQISETDMLNIRNYTSLALSYKIATRSALGRFLVKVATLINK